MTPQERQKVRQAITAEMAETNAEILILRESSDVVTINDAAGRVSRTDAIQNKAISDALLVAASNRLNALNMTLDQIDGPTFGTCIACGLPIGMKRHVAIPESRRCVHCAE